MPSIGAIAGMLEHPITIKTEVEVQDTKGDITKTIQTHAEVYASIEPLTGREREIASKVDATVDHKITIHYCEGLNAKMHIVFGDKTFNIRWIQNPGMRNIVQMIYATEAFETQ